MWLSRSDIICDIPAPQMREVLRRAEEWGAIDDRTIASVLGLDAPIAAHILRRMVSAGLIIRNAPKESGYALTALGQSVAKAYFSKGIMRSTADEIVRSLPARIAEINSAGEYLHEIRYAFVFGSYVTEDEQRLGAVDIAIAATERVDITQLPIKGLPQHSCHEPPFDLAGFASG